MQLKGESLRTISTVEPFLISVCRSATDWEMDGPGSNFQLEMRRKRRVLGIFFHRYFADETLFQLRFNTCNVTVKRDSGIADFMMMVLACISFRGLILLLCVTGMFYSSMPVCALKCVIVNQTSSGVLS